MTRFAPKVELFYDGAWQNVTADTYVRDKISITRGRADEGTGVDPGKCTVTFNNRNGKYSPRNPTSPLYGKIGRNTPIRVSETSLLNRVLAADNFNRSVTDSWGTSSSGNGWWQAGGSAAERDVDGAAGTMTISTFDNAERHNFFTDTVNGETVVSLKVDQTAPAGGRFATAAIFRRDTTGGYFAVVVTMESNGTVRIGALHSGVFYDGSNAPYATGLTYTAGTKLWLRTRLVGLRIQGRVWLDGSTEPTTWNVDQELHVGSTNGTSPVSGGVGLMTQIVGTPAGAVKFSYDDLSITDPVAGIRFVGEVSSWPPQWDVSGNDAYTSVEAAGILRRLGQGASPLHSAMRRVRGAPNRNPSIVGYWPCEDEQGATQIASALPGGKPMRIAGTPSLAAFDGFASSAPLPTMGSARFVGELPAHSTTNQIAYAVLVHVPSGGASAGQELMAVRTTGTANLWIVKYDGAGGDLTLTVYDEERNQLATSGSVDFNINGKLLQVQLLIRPDGANARCTLEVTEVNGGQQTWDVVATGRTVGRARRVTGAWNQGLTDVAMGHFSVANRVDGVRNSEEPFYAFGFEQNAYLSETAGTRFKRLCQEEGVPFVAYGNLDATVPMGSQRIATLLELLDDAAASDGGMSHETRYEAGLTYHTRERLYNQPSNFLDRPLLPLDYNAGHISPPFEPVDDDTAVRNDITVQRQGGSSVRVVQETGPLNVQRPEDDPDGVGRYDEQATLSLHTDDLLADQAGWRRHLGTWDEPRYPTVTVDLAKNLALLEEVAAVESGDRFTIANPPVWVPPGPIELLARGYTETFDEFWWEWTVNATPGGPYRVGVLDDTVLGRLDTDGSRLAAAVTSTATSLSVASTGVAAPLNSNSTFDAGVTHWEPVGGTFVHSTARSYRGGGSGLLTPDGVAATVRARTILAESPPVIPGRVHTFSVWVYRDATGARDVDLSVDFRDVNGTNVSFPILATVNVPSRAWTFLVGSITPPAGAVKAWLNVNQRTTPAVTDLLYVDQAAWAAPALWTTAAAEMPYRALMGGEEVEVTAAVTEVTGFQTLTVARSKNGVVKSHAVGTDFRLKQPLILGL